MELQNTLDKLIVAPTLPPPCPPTLLLIMHEQCINLTVLASAELGQFFVHFYS